MFLDVLGIEGDQGGSVDVDIVKTGVEPFADQVFQSFDLFSAVFVEFLGVDLKMVPLDKYRAFEFFFNCSGEDDGGQFVRTLMRVADFRFLTFLKSIQNLH